MVNNTTIDRAGIKDSNLLQLLGKETFLQSHGSSASRDEIDEYVNKTYSESRFISELSVNHNLYYIIKYFDLAVGYSKIIIEHAYFDSEYQNYAKLERLYILEQYHKLKIGLSLLNFNIDIAKSQGKKGMWLYVWKDNQKALNFYLKSGFKIIGEHDFKITERHSNPNFKMMLEF